MSNNITLLCPSDILKDTPLQSIANDYIKRIHQPIIIPNLLIKIKSNDTETDIKQKQADAILAYLEKTPSQTFIICLDERGKNLNSIEFAKKLSQSQVQGFSNFCFIIGGAFGLSKLILDKAHLQLSFGNMVWPHRMVGIMLLEQIYRAQQINAGHPYHKE